MTLLFWTGLSLFVVAVATRVDRLLYLAFVFVALGTWNGGLLAVQTGMYFQGQTRSRVIFTLNALFDSGAIAYLGLWGIGQSSQQPAVSSSSGGGGGGTITTLTWLASGYLGLSILLFGGGLYFWMVAVPEAPKEEKEEDYEDDEFKLLQNSLEETVDGPAIKSLEEAESREITELGDDAESSSASASASTSASASAFDGIEELPPQQSKKEPQETEDIRQMDDSYIIVAERSPRQQLASGPYLIGR
jgi:hypothetical protein